MAKRAPITRKTKIEAEVVKPSPKDKFFTEIAYEESMRQAPVPKIEAKNSNQKLALAMMREARPVIFLAGSAGVGKSMLAAYHAACLLKSKRIEKIFLVRPAVSVGKSIGLIPGDINSKLLPYFAQTLEHLAKFLGRGYMNYCVEKQIIEMKPSEYLRGMSFEGCCVIAEESQNYTGEEFEMVLTRMGDNSFLVFTGDEKQHDLRGVSGLESTLSLIDNMEASQPDYLLDEDLDVISSGIGIVRFTPDDVVRSGLTRAFVKIYFNN